MRKKRKKLVSIILIVVLVIISALVALTLFSRHQMGKIPHMSFDDVLNYSTKGNKNAVITVGVIKNGEALFTVYGEDGKKLPNANHVYEIGSVTKTFNSSLISKAINEGRLELNDTIDKWLDLPTGKDYPTVKQLLTHTSGYKSYYFEYPMITNFFTGRNSFYGIDRDMILKSVSNADLEQKSYPFAYSNFGFAVLGLVLEEVYQSDYTTLMNTYLKEDLQLKNSKISDQSGDLKKYWDWKPDDSYISAGAITSDITDMLAYAQMQLDEPDYMRQCHKGLNRISSTNEMYKLMDINMSEVGMSWILDNENNMVWHNGGTGNFNSYIGFCLDTQTAVVVLSNLSPSQKIPATVLGVKLLKSIQ